MARMYSGRKGQAGSHKPNQKTVPAWVTYQPKEVEQIVVKLAKQDKSASEIGMVLRDSYGIPNVKVLLGKRITDVLKEKKVSKKLPEDLIALIKRHIQVMKHLEENKEDQVAHRGVQLTESRIHRLVKYYKKRKLLTPEWTYDKQNAKLYLE